MVAGEVVAGEQARHVVPAGGQDEDHAGSVVPITKPLLAILEMRKHGPDETELGSDAYVFGNAVGEARKDFKNCWSRVLKLSKIAGLHFHDLRREAASRMLESGAQLHEISVWLGHDDLNTTATYLRITQNELDPGCGSDGAASRGTRTKTKTGQRCRPPTPSAPSGAASYTIN